MRSDSQGIQQLLAAEKRADEKVTLARKRKAARLKQAKEEAQIEIKQFREEREKQFKEYESQFKGSRELSAIKIEEETEVKIKEMSEMVAANKDKVIDYLLSEIFAIKVQLHKNIRFD